MTREIFPEGSADIESVAVTAPLMGKARPPWPGGMIQALIAAHVLAGVAVISFAANSQWYLQDAIMIALLFPLIVCQCSLVGLWGAVGRSHPMARVFGTLMAVALLGTEMWLCMGEIGFRGSLKACAFVLSVTSPVAAITGIARYYAPTTPRIDESTVAGDGLQFSIRNLILLTIMIASLLALGRLLPPYFESGKTLKSLAVICSCAVFVALALIWAMLGEGNPVVRCYLVFAFVFVLFMGAGWFGADWDIRLLIAILLLHALFLLGSLVVFRRCGYRLRASASTVPVAVAGS